MDWKKYLSPVRLRKSLFTEEERRKRNDYRTDIESDFGRVIFSSACRRLHDKTQVFPLTTDDNIHSRLTHSMEVMNIGQSFVFMLSKNENFKMHTKLTEVEILRDLAAALKVACLVHDIGNPPFGHFGEVSIQSYFKKLFENTLSNSKFKISYRDKWNMFRLAHSDTRFDFTQFDGNAEGLRVLTKLQFIETLDGLNLTCASLGAYLKYPNVGQKARDAYIGKHKHGVFTTEKNVLKNIIESCCLPIKAGCVIRHPLSFLMEASDSICYLVMDIEDGLKKKILSISDVCGCIEQNCNGEKYIYDDKGKSLLESVQKIKEDVKNERKQIMDLRTCLMGYLIDLALCNFVNQIEAIEKGSYSKELIDDDKNEIAKRLGEISRKYILNSREVISLEITGKAVIEGILDAYMKMFFSDDGKLRNRAKQLISKTIFLVTLQEHLDVRHVEEKADVVYDKFDVKDFTVEERLRILRDFVSCMTDKFALNHYRKLSGQQIF